MSVFLRITLFLLCILTFWYIIRKIRKSQMQIPDAILWICFSIFLLIASVFPQIFIVSSELLKIESPANFVFLCIIFLLIIIIFLLSIKVSQLDSKLKNLVQHIAINENKQEDSNE